MVFNRAETPYGARNNIRAVLKVSEMIFVIRRSLPLIVAGLLTACASGGGSSDLVADPLEGANRAIHGFNKGLDSAVLQPASQAYDYATPTLFRHLFGNAMSHLELPGVFANQLLQGEISEASATLGRFTVNTIYGAAGTLDPASEIGLPKESTDFGLTMASWGVGEGAYLELPLFGPSTVRDAIGTVVDTAFRPTTYLSGGVETTIATATVRAVDIVDRRARSAVLIDDLLYRSEDSYVSTRASYIQNRRRKAGGGETDVDALPDLFAQ